MTVWHISVIWNWLRCNQWDINSQLLTAGSFASVSHVCVCVCSCQDSWTRDPTTRHGGNAPSHSTMVTHCCKLPACLGTWQPQFRYTLTDWGGGLRPGQDWTKIVIQSQDYSNNYLNSQMREDMRFWWQSSGLKAHMFAHKQKEYKCSSPNTVWSILRLSSETAQRQILVQLLFLGI